MRGPFEDRKGKSLLDGGGTVVYGSNHGVVYAPGGLGVLAGNNDSMPDILYYHYLNTSMGFKHGVSLLFIFVGIRTKCSRRKHSSAGTIWTMRTGGR